MVDFVPSPLLVAELRLWVLQSVMPLLREKHSLLRYSYKWIWYWLPCNRVTLFYNFSRTMIEVVKTENLSVCPVGKPLFNEVIICHCLERVTVSCTWAVFSDDFCCVFFVYLQSYVQIQAMFVAEDLTMKLSRPHAHRYIGCLLHNRFPRRPIPAVTYQSHHKRWS